ncbi:MAG: damage-inducible protein DinB [Ignavibacteriae bacterium]|nr:MAG: damage-inducible protein DinB [Ignavibacteriota bacterium]
MTNGLTLHREFLKELEAEATASRRCLERIPEKLFDWKPHERSMSMYSLSQMVADFPRWIKYIVETPEIDFATYPQIQPKTTSDLVKLFDDNLKGVKAALEHVSDEALSEPFSLKNNGKVLMSSPKKESISSSINHLVHHRGQLTVYMRLNNIPVPSIYGPSADEGSF